MLLPFVALGAMLLLVLGEGLASCRWALPLVLDNLHVLQLLRCWPSQAHHSVAVAMDLDVLDYLCNEPQPVLVGRVLELAALCDLCKTCYSNKTTINIDTSLSDIIAI